MVPPIILNDCIMHTGCIHTIILKNRNTNTCSGNEEEDTTLELHGRRETTAGMLTKQSGRLVFHCSAVVVSVLIYPLCECVFVCECVCVCVSVYIYVSVYVCVSVYVFSLSICLFVFFTGT